MVPQPMMNMSPPYNFIEGVINTEPLRYFQENSGRVILAAFQHHEVRRQPIQLFKFTTNLSHSTSLLSRLHKDKRTEL